jgi:hypothetical protein
MTKRLGRWFRVYDSILDNPKVQQLSAENFRSLINLWALASQNGGALPSESDIAFRLRMKPQAVKKLLSTLKAAKLLNKTECGLVPHNWSKRQFESDNSTERVRKHRNGKRNVSCNVSETADDRYLKPFPSESVSDSESVYDSDSSIGKTSYGETTNSLKANGKAPDWNLHTDDGDVRPLPPFRTNGRAA